jgi:hypothetical protein
MLYVSLIFEPFGTGFFLWYWVFETHCMHLEHKFATSVKIGFLDLCQFLVLNLIRI